MKRNETNFLKRIETNFLRRIETNFRTQVRQIPIETIKTIENTLFLGVFAAGALWVLAGMGTAYDAYMIATKKQVPAGLDEALSKYVEPFLTPGLAVILLFSVLLGGLQVYKFEGGRK